MPGDPTESFIKNLQWYKKCSKQKLRSMLVGNSKKENIAGKYISLMISSRVNTKCIKKQDLIFLIQFLKKVSSKIFTRASQLRPIEYSLRGSEVNTDPLQAKVVVPADFLPSARVVVTKQDSSFQNGEVPSKSENSTLLVVEVKASLASRPTHRVTTNQI